MNTTALVCGTHRSSSDPAERSSLELELLDGERLLVRVRRVLRVCRMCGLRACQVGGSASLPSSSSSLSPTKAGVR